MRHADRRYANHYAAQTQREAVRHIFGSYVEKMSRVPGAEAATKAEKDLERAAFQDIEDYVEQA